MSTTEFPITKNEGVLRRRLLADAVQHTEWHGARTEYRVVGIIFGRFRFRCLCSHAPIAKLCFLQNIHSGKRFVVGSDCVNKFISDLGIRYDLVLNCLDKISQNRYASVTDHLSNYAYEEGWIDGNEREFCYRTVRKKLTPAEMMHRVAINTRIRNAWHQQQVELQAELDLQNAAMSEAF